MEEPVVASFTDILTASGEVLGFALTGLGTLINTITANPILLMGFLMALTGFVIGVAQRVMNLR